MIIGIDFDGTCVTHEFPQIGSEIGATEVLKKLVAKGHQLILFTMRSDILNPTSDDYNIHQQGGIYLTEAVEWFSLRGIPLYGVNTNPRQHTWTTSPKAYCNLYIDDAALGVPLTTAPGVTFPYVDWVKVERILTEKGIL